MDFKTVERSVCDLINRSKHSYMSVPSNFLNRSGGKKKQNVKLLCSESVQFIGRIKRQVFCFKAKSHPKR